MRKLFTLFFGITLLAGPIIAQGTRYVDEVFSDVVTIKDQIYSVNITVVSGSPALDTLRFDLYMPAGDVCTMRPLAVVLHTGTFLPRGFVAPTGDKNDYANVQVCERLAKQGYVAASIQYRKGWNPIAPTDIVRRSTIINAAYRSIQDMYAFLRYMNLTVTDLDNPYKIDTSRVAIFGIGTGGFVGFNAAVLTQQEIYIDKFRDPVSGVPFIDTSLVGDLHGIKPGAINIPNHVGYNDHFDFVFGLDGAVGDSSWMEDGNSVPLVAAGTVTHPTTPYGIDPITGEVNCDLPVFAGAGTGIFVVNIGGSLCMIQKANELGINNPLKKGKYNDPVSEAIRQNPNTFSQEHLWAISLPGPQTGPWEYWDSTFWKTVPYPLNPSLSIHDVALATNPDMSLDKANRYIDTAMWFFSPRAFVALKLNELVCSCEGVVANPNIFMINDFECQRNFNFTAGNDRLMIMNNPDPDSKNNSEKVGAYLDPAHDSFAALCANFGGSVDLSTFNVFKMDVNSPAAGVPFLLKLEGGTSPAYEVWTNTKSAGSWETITADFSSQASADHTRVCIFPNGGVDTPDEQTYLLDNLRLDKKTRYIDEVFPEVVKVENQIYSVNITVASGSPAPDTLRFDLYMPAGDVCTARPLAVILHTGTFLPRGFVAPTGDKDDYANVQVCQRLAKEGYVAASIQYRKGWNPIAPTDIVRRSTIINAAYRSIQDMYAFIRYMNRTVVDFDNPYNIDPDRVSIFGIGTGGFVGFNAAVLSQQEIYIDKFRDPVSGVPFIDTLLVGDLHGIKPGAINIPNNVGYRDDFQFVFGLDGAVGDSSWMEDKNSVPLVAAGTVTHPTTPYGIDPISGEINCDLPVFAGAGTGIFVVNIGGSLCMIEKANSLGINDPLNKLPYDDAVSEAIRNDANGFGQEHLWPINLPGPQTGPWEYWDSTFWKTVPYPLNPSLSIHAVALATNPDMSLDKANRYIDTALWFFSPRSFAALKLNEVICSCEGVVPDPSIFMVNDFECQKNYPFGAGADRVMIMDNPDPDAANSSEKVGAYSDPAHDSFAALCVNFGGKIDLSEFNEFKVDVNSPAAGVPFLLKLEGGTSPAYEFWTSNTVAGSWETLSANFSSQACEDHTRICIFPNGGVEAPDEVTYLLDNLRLEKSGDTCLTIGLSGPKIETLSISPNPVDNVLYIRNPGSAVHFRLMNTLGQQVLDLNAENQEIVSMFVSNLSSGLYLIGAYNEQGKLIGIARIVKN